MDYLFLIAGAFAGGFVNGFSGTGTALFSLAFFLAVLSPLHAVALAAVLSVFSGFQGAWEVRHNIAAQWRRILILSLPGVLGVPVGIQLLNRVDATSLKWLVALLLVFYGGYFGFRKALPSLQIYKPVSHAVVGGIGGILGGLASLSGSLPSIFLSMFDWPRTEIRALLQAYNVIVLSTVVVGLALAGAFENNLSAVAICLPIGFVAARLGIAVFRRVSDQLYRRLLILMCLLSGLAIVTRELLRLF